VTDPMTETAGWGAAPSFLPPAVARRALRDDAREAIEARRAEAEQEARREELRQRALSLYAEQATARGELVSAVALATGQVHGRSIAEILEAGRLAGEREDLVMTARLHREGHGDPEPLHVEFGEPRILTPAARSSIGLRIFNRARRFGEAQRTRAAAEAAARASADDFGFVCERRPREDADPVVVVSASRRRGGVVPADSGVRFR
jgi:hypothetical protein